MVEWNRVDPPDWGNFKPIVKERENPKTFLGKLRVSILYILLALVVSAIVACFGGLFGLLLFADAETHAGAAGKYMTVTSVMADPAQRGAFLIGAAVVGGIVFITMLVAWIAPNWFAQQDVDWNRGEGSWISFWPY